MYVILIIIALAAAAAFAVMLSLKMETIRHLEVSVNRLKRSLDEMDEQAKLIVRTDMELNKVQQELDKRIASLTTLQKLSRSISSALEIKAIFKGIKASYLQELGFDKALAFLWDDKENTFAEILNIGYGDAEIAAIAKYLNNKKETC
jgi:signal transduction histidine kinase